MNLQSARNYYILTIDLNCEHTEWGNPSNYQKGNILYTWQLNNEIRFRCKLFATCRPANLFLRRYM